MLLDKSVIVSKAQYLTGDTTYYDRNTGFGVVFGNMFMDDSIRYVVSSGNYVYHNELTKFAFATERAMAIEYSQGDSLFLHADTLKSQVIDDQRLVNAYYGVRFYRTDIQGVCDSLRYSTVDSTIVMYTNPVLWNMNYQIYGDTIFINMNDSTIEKVIVKDFAFLAQFKADSYYDQLTGNVMTAYFEDGDMHRMDMNGNVEVIFYPEESDKSLIGLNSAQSSYLKAFFVKRQLDKLTMWPEVNGSLTPIPMIMSDKLFLKSFRWYSDLRPTSKEDIFREIKMKEEDIIKPVNIFTQDELEGNSDLDN